MNTPDVIAPEVSNFNEMSKVMNNNLVFSPEFQTKKAKA